MSSTATQRLRLDKQATGDNPNAWGIRLNSALDLIDESQGLSVVTVAANVTLSSNNFTTDQARRAVLRFTGAGGFTVTLPAVEKLYLIDNRCAADVTLKTATGASAVIRAGSKVPAYVDALDTTAVDPSLDQVKKAAAPVDLNGQRLTNAGASTADTDLIQRGQVAALSSVYSTLAQAWATQATGEVVVGQGYSARYHANLASGSSLSAGMSMSAASASATLAQQWAISLTLVDGTYYGSRYYAQAAAASAAAAATFDPSSFYTKTASDVRFVLASNKAAGSDIRGLTDDVRFITAKSVADAIPPVVWNYSTTFTPDLSTFITATMTLTGNLTLANPTNPKPGQAGEIVLTQDGTGSRTIAFGSAWKFAGGAPTASIAPGAVDVISYRVVSSTQIVANYSKAYA